MTTRRTIVMIMLALAATLSVAGAAHAGILGDPALTVAGSVDEWVSNLIIDEGRSHVNASPWAQDVSLETFNFAVGNNRSRVTPFVVRLNDVNTNGDYTDDNNFTIMKIGTPRASGTDYNATGVFNLPFDGGGPMTITLAPGEAIGAAFIDANPDGSGGGAGSVIPMNGNVTSGEQWYNGGGGDPHPSPPAPLTEGQTFGGGPSAGVQNRNYEFNIEFSLPPQRNEIAGDGVIGIDQLTDVEQNLVMQPTVVTGAQRIRLVQNVSNTFQIAEIMAFEDGTGTNVALQANGGVATALDSGAGTNPSLVNDGNLAGNHPNEWHSGSAFGTWVEVAFASPSDLDSAHIYGRTDCCGDRQDDFDLVLYDGGGTEIYRQQVLGLGTGPGANRLFDLEVAVSGELLATLRDEGTYVFELDPSPSSDQLGVENPDPSFWSTVLDVNDATLEVEFAPGTQPRAGDTWTLLLADTLQGSFDQLVLPGGLGWDTSNLMVDGTITAVPEPGTFALAALGLLGLLAYARRRRTH